VSNRPIGSGPYKRANVKAEFALHWRKS
jgi:hypothetical protein